MALTRPALSCTASTLSVRVRNQEVASLMGRERQVQQQGRQRAEALAERSVEIAQAMVPLAGALARGGG